MTSFQRVCKIAIMVKMQVLFAAETAAGLDELAKVRRISKSELVRNAVSEYLAHKRSETMQAEMRDYAERHGGSSDEFVRQTGDHITERWLRETPW